MGSSELEPLQDGCVSVLVDSCASEVVLKEEWPIICHDCQEHAVTFGELSAAFAEFGLVELSHKRRNFCFVNQWRFFVVRYSAAAFRLYVQTEKKSGIENHTFFSA